MESGEWSILNPSFFLSTNNNQNKFTCFLRYAQVVKLADTLGSGSSEITLVRVRISPWAHTNNTMNFNSKIFPLFFTNFYHKKNQVPESTDT